MRTVMRWFSTWLQTRALERERDQELRSRVADHVRDPVESGLTPEQARREATLECGGLESCEEANDFARIARTGSIRSSRGALHDSLIHPPDR